MVASCVTCGPSNITHRNGEVSRDLTYTTKNDEYINRDSTSMRWLNVIVCGVARIKKRSWVLISLLHTMVGFYVERQCCRSRIEHISKRFFVLRRILDTRRKNVHIVNDSMIHQYHIDHRRSWLKRPSWGWRASPMSKLKDGCVVCDLRTFKYNTSQWRGVEWPYLHHQKRWVY